MRLVCLALVALFVAATPLRTIRAEEEQIPPGMTESHFKSLRGKLRKRSAEWWRYRKKLAQRCPQCKGAGKVRWRRRRRIELVDCPKCDGFKMHVDKDVYRRLFYDMRSPEFRMQEDIRAKVTAEFVQAKEGKPFPVVLKRYAVKKIEVVDATHGIVYVERNKDSVARPQQWVWSEEPGKSATWFLYDVEADGAWPSAETPPPEEEPTPEPTPGPGPPVVPVAPAPAPEPEPEPVPTPPKRDTHPRDEIEASQALVRRWAEERGDIRARVIRIELGLEGVEGHEKTVAEAREFLEAIDGWLTEAKPYVEESTQEVEEQGLGIRMDYRLKINTLYFRAHRRLELVEKMLVVVIPDLND